MDCMRKKRTCNRTKRAAMKEQRYNETSSDESDDATIHCTSSCISEHNQIEENASVNKPEGCNNVDVHDEIICCEEEPSGSEESEYDADVASIGNELSDREPNGSGEEFSYSNFSDTTDQTEEAANVDFGVGALRRKLQDFANECDIKHVHIDRLLKTLKEHGYAELPGTARTLLGTKTFACTTKSQMEYIFLGLKKPLHDHLQSYDPEVFANDIPVEISLNIDGVPVFKSKKSSMWPLLCCVHLRPCIVFVSVITYGEKKPSDLEFLREAVTELKDILDNGLVVHRKSIRIHLRAVICDAPAKAMVKAVKQYNGYYGCDRCELKGKHTGGRHIFHQFDNLHLRTNASFRVKTNDEHHNGDSIFCELDIDMITAFPIDYMHLLCLGVMRRLLRIWTKADKGKRVEIMHSLPPSKQNRISENLVSLQPHIPDAFARKPRSLAELANWKATEFRQFLLYTGTTVLAGVLSKEPYAHFATLSLASRILVSPTLAKKYLPYMHADYCATLCNEAMNCMEKAVLCTTFTASYTCVTMWSCMVVWMLSQLSPSRTICKQ